MKKKHEIIEVSIFVSLSTLTTRSCFVYLLTKIKEKQAKENFFIFLCSISVLECRLFSFIFGLPYSKAGNLNATKALCFALPMIYKSTIMFRRCLCNLIFRFPLQNNQPKTANFCGQKSLLLFYCNNKCISYTSYIWLCLLFDWAYEVVNYFSKKIQINNLNKINIGWNSQT